MSTVKFFDQELNEIFKGSFDDYGLPSEDLLPVKRKDKWGYLNTKGKEVIECRFDYAGEFQNGTGIVRSD